MNILEYIEVHCPIRDKVRVKLENPYKRIEESNDLPFDKIGPDESGHITKLVEIEDNRYISVMDLIGMTKEEVDATQDLALQTVYSIYMSKIDMKDMNIIDILECVKQYQSVKTEREAKLGVLSL